MGYFDPRLANIPPGDMWACFMCESTTPCKHREPELVSWWYRLPRQTPIQRRPVGSAEAPEVSRPAVRRAAG